MQRRHLVLVTDTEATVSCSNELGTESTANELGALARILGVVTRSGLALDQGLGRAHRKGKKVQDHSVGLQR
jgi:hypothetical protein